MTDRIDHELAKLYAHISQQPLTTALDEMTMPQVKERATPDRRRRMINLFAGLAAVAVVASSVVLFAVELRSHRSTAPSGTSSSASLLKDMPLLGNGGVPTSARIVIPLTRGHGSVQLKTFVPQGALILQYDCAGPGSFKITSTNGVVGSDLAQCSTSLGVTTMTVDGPYSINGVKCSADFVCPNGYDGKPLTLDITAAPSMSWEILVAETTTWFPQVVPVQADWQVLVPLTFGTGSTTLPTFSVAPDESIRVNIVCNSGTSGKALEIAPNPLWPDGQQVSCLVFNADGSISELGVGPAVSNSGSGLGPISVQFTADPSVSWEVRITEGPEGILLPELGNLGPVTQDVGVAPKAIGIGSTVLTTFTPTQRYTIAFSCSGPGPLTVITSGVSHVATTLCGGNTGWFTPPHQVPGQPVSISVDAPSSVGWEIQAVQVYGSSWGAGGASMP
jgi:hypothetical protein